MRRYKARKKPFAQSKLSAFRKCPSLACKALQLVLIPAFSVPFEDLRLQRAQARDICNESSYDLMILFDRRGTDVEEIKQPFAISSVHSSRKRSSQNQVKLFCEGPLPTPLPPFGRHGRRTESCRLIRLARNGGFPTFAPKNFLCGHDAIADLHSRVHHGLTVSAWEETRRKELQRPMGILRERTQKAVAREPEYLVAHACFDCRKSWKVRAATEAVCPHCAAPLFEMGRAFKAPKKADVEQWRKVEALWRLGFRFWSVGSTEVEPLPSRLRDVDDFVHRNPNHPSRLVR